jgi:CopG family nickel-responsive transcriptional regulator
MSDLVRFGVSIENSLLEKFDSFIKEKHYKNRSEAIRDLIRQNLVKEEWIKGKEVAGVISLVYNHHLRDLVNILTDIQHDFYQLIISTQHIHLDHDNCLEIVVVKGKPNQIQQLASKLKATRGVKFSELSLATTGKELI